ncbi:MAG TPA: hypothetical protein VNE38_02060 [Ktedonobacteraceae bacterium]|nr:hypothetical protein [Ktedonobacteraceae bacterium]
MIQQNEKEVATGWATKRLLPGFEAPDRLEIYDTRGAAYDVQLCITILAGLINRQKPRIYLLSNSDAESLFKTLLAHIPHEYINSGATDSLDAMLAKYRALVKGIIIYDPELLDSVNVATTMAGLRDAIVVSPPQAVALQQKPYELPVVADLRIYHWKNRLQAYRWAQRNLLKEASQQVVAGMGPGIATGLRSYLVATRAFVYWLNPLNILPDPSNAWTTERCLMKRILRAFQPGTPHLGWLVNEFAGIHMTSKAALPVLPSDFFYNLEVWTAIQPPASEEADLGDQDSTADTCQDGQPDTTATRQGNHASTATAHQSAQPTTADRGQGDREGRPYPITNEVANPVQGRGDREGRPGPGRGSLGRPSTSKVYVSFTMSDGDNLQYNQHRLYQMWQDPARGSIPLGWTVSPVLCEAAPALAAYYEQTATPGDELIAGPSGAGYMWPSSWPADQLSAYTQLTGALMQRMHLHTIQVLDGPLSLFFPRRAWQKQYAELLAPYGLRGILSGDSYCRTGWWVAAGVAVIQNLGLSKSVARTLKLIKNNTPAHVHRPQFINVYIYAWTMTPTDIKKVIETLDNRYEVVTPGQLCALIAQTRERA